MDLTDRIAQLALSHYANELPTKGKPGEREWTVYAALVATHSSNDMWVVCSGTGTKCTAQRCQGSIVHDAHAEVLVRRGFLRVLWQEIMHSSAESLNAPRRILDRIDPANQTAKWRLRKELELYMYISDSPCGDASIYPVRAKNNNNPHDNTSITNSDSNKPNTSHAATELSFTGAKAIVSSHATTGAPLLQSHSAQQHLIREPDVQQLGQLRSKSGRSNLETSRRSFSMSCSDKLVRWSVLGLQGQTLSGFVIHPICLKGIVVGLDPRAMSSSEQLQALVRAIPDRVVSTFQDLPDDDESFLVPTVTITEQVFAQGKAIVEHLAASETDKKRKREDDSQKEPSYNSCGMAIHWQQCCPVVEMLVGARGIRQGKKPKCDDDIYKLRSRLSRSSLFECASHCCPTPPLSYQKWKQSMGSDVYASRKRAVLSKSPLSGWLVASDSSDFVPRTIVAGQSK